MRSDGTNSLVPGGSLSPDRPAGRNLRESCPCGRSIPVGFVRGGEVDEGETVGRVRRQAHGLAAWITTQTASITVELAVPTLHPISGVSA